MRDSTRQWAREIARTRHAYLPSFAAEHVAEVARLAKERADLVNARGDGDVCWVDEHDGEPLVTVRIATRNRPDELVERALASATRQTYERLDILVVGDDCDERTARAVASIADDRIRFVNLPVMGRYPESGVDRWRVAGCKPMNAALLLAAGSWIAPLDDDDEFTHDHVEVLLNHARRERLEFVWSDTEQLCSTGVVGRIGKNRMERGATTHGAVLYSAGLFFMEYSATAYRLHEPADWNLWKRMSLIGVRMGYLPTVTYRYWQAGPDQYPGAAG
ncbi:MAG: glycosyltransferase [Ilumatobacter sp.]|uniref:glycosyltransferase family 2 protein n=1 Tax=Ilumatobacter sp. TaxID=1967498 RepID=UPI003296EC82